MRATAVELKESIQVMAGPLRALPPTFFETSEQRSQWADLLDVWRVAGEVLMEGQAVNKDPHWMEVQGASSCVNLFRITTKGGTRIV